MKYVLDTNVLLNDPQSITAFNDNTVIIPFIVFEELDRIKQKKLDVSRDARYVIRLLDEILHNSTFDEMANSGVRLDALYQHLPESAILRVPMHNSYPKDMHDKNINHLDLSVADNVIIYTAYKENAILVTRDINMRLKAMACGVTVQDYKKDTVLKDSSLIHTGHHHVKGDLWKEFQNANVIVYTDAITEKGKTIQYIQHQDYSFLPELSIGDYLYDQEDVLFVFDGVVPKQFNENEPEENYFRFIDVGQALAMRKKVWGITPRNIGQAMAINSILDPNVHLTVLLGSAGTGKTLITMASALELVMEKKLYNRIIFTKTQDSLFSDIGFLPGTEEQKIMPYCGAAIDALEYIHRNDANPAASIEFLLDSGKVKFLSPNTLRGRSLGDKTLLIADEASNFTPAMMKMILSRIGENSKVIIMGNLAQIDNQYITPINSGLTYTTEKCKDWEGCRIIELEGVERSPLAKFVEENFLI